MSIHISLINPEGIKNSVKGFIAALSAYTVFELDIFTGCANIADYFTDDPVVINHRMDLFYDILNIEPLYKFLYDAGEKLKGLELELYTKKEPENTSETMLSKVYILKYYIEMLDWMYEFIKSERTI